MPLLPFALGALLVAIPILSVDVLPVWTPSSVEPAHAPQETLEARFRRMIAERPDYASSPGKRNRVVFRAFYVDKPVPFTMVYGNSEAEDERTMVYKVRAHYDVHSENFNTGTGQTYPPSTREVKRRFNCFIGRTKQWKCEMTGTTADWK
jgi:hypothetical protein